MKERIILSVELVDKDNKDARASLRVPYDCRETIFGPWLDTAIAELRSECKAALNTKQPHCKNCGERIRSDYDSKEMLCGLCADDERNK